MLKWESEEMNALETVTGSFAEWKLRKPRRKRGCNIKTVVAVMNNGSKSLFI
jgi:hypothetical protein